ncbi:MAG TPA: hypothetical protein VIE43_08110 [Thermoanaerobaculia bacterium]|nr:hypothetical protein [Thermoanaerobaculia bacterium]
MSYPKILARTALACFLAAALGAFALWACGPYFPPWILDNEAGILEAPTSWLRDALQPLQKPGASPRAVVAESDDPYKQTALVDEADLKGALEGVPADRREALLDQYRRFRTALAAYAKVDSPQDAPRKPSGLTVPAGLPGEFADYLQGAVAYHEDRFQDARQVWEKLLSQPAAERRHRTVWAAFMIGKAHLQLDPAKAAPWFERTRELARQGFPDPLGLAAASFGWEASAATALKRPDEALVLYLQQMSTGDPTGLNSIRFIAHEALSDPQALSRVAASAQARPILTAYVLSLWNRAEYGSGPLDPAFARAWLAAIRKAGVSNVEEADRLAWLAYRAGDFATASEWLRRAPADAPMALWIRAKLLLREGKLAEGEALLAKATLALPAAPAPEHDAWSAYQVGGQPALRPRAAGELGAARLAKGEYVAALDSLLRGGWWTDAAYVAEQVLTLDELRAYVDKTWTSELASRYKPGEPQNVDEPGSAWEVQFAGIVPPPDEKMAYDLRYLLGRRLARAGRLADARPYLPESQRGALDDLARSLALGRAGSHPAAERSQALFRAACLDRFQGMELLGTEVEPDWFLHGGSFEQDPFAKARAEAKAHPHLGPTPDERQRVAANRTVPDKRFHYRYQGMTLAQEAAKLLPAGTEERASVLATAGNWVEGRDPEGARPLYDAIQSCCRNTGIAQKSRKVHAITNIADACPADVQPKSEP